MKLFVCSIFLLLFCTSRAQQEDQVFKPNIYTTKLYKAGDPISFPLLMLGSNDLLELHFDDLHKDIKQYYYAFQLCNADWTPSLLSSFDYTKGFQNVRISNYRSSSIALTAYTHYQGTIPDRNSYPTRSGNYVLKVFLNSDTSQLAFTKRFVVVDAKSSVSAQVQQPFNTQWFKTHQKLQIGINVDTRIQIFTPQDLKVVVLQNNNWKTALFLNNPTIFRGNFYEYSDESITAMPALREWRWIDLRSFRLKSDRMQELDAKSTVPVVFVKPDPSRASQPYLYYQDLGGRYTIETLESVNPFWQGDYGHVHFSFFPPGNRPFEGRDVYLFGELTNYGRDTAARMTFNAEGGAYEKTLFLKQGYYNYMYATWPSGKSGYPDMSQTEGNFWGTENTYTILVYYKAFGGRADELIGYTAISSLFQRTGF
ncbi:MAG TPA: DUF5103 domain-containing protein [Niastella sp.]|nr:DUF5103 domain-containing protein [Niastella sp.]